MDCAICDAAEFVRPSVRLLLESGLKFGRRKRANDSIKTKRQVAGCAVLLVEITSLLLALVEVPPVDVEADVIAATVGVEV